jgi:hypothetical protein
MNRTRNIHIGRNRKGFIPLVKSLQNYDIPGKKKRREEMTKMTGMTKMTKIS